MNRKTLILLFPLLLLMFTARAENDRSQAFGDYVVYYNALPTDVLQADVAGEYGITRSKFRGFITVSVQRKDGQPVSARIQASASNLNGQSRNLSLHQVKEGPAIYYIDDFRISNEETLKFSLKIQPENANQAFNLKFSQQFFTN